MRDKLADWNTLNLAYALVCIGPMLNISQTRTMDWGLGIRLLLYHMMIVLMPLVSVCTTAASMMLSSRSRRLAETVAACPTVLIMVLCLLFLSLLRG